MTLNTDSKSLTTMKRRVSFLIDDCATPAKTCASCALNLLRRVGNSGWTFPDEISSARRLAHNSLNTGSVSKEDISMTTRTTRALPKSLAVPPAFRLAFSAALANVSAANTFCASTRRSNFASIKRPMPPVEAVRGATTSRKVQHAVSTICIHAFAGIAFASFPRPATSREVSSVI